MSLVTTGPFYEGYREKNPDYSPATFKCAEETVEALLSHATTSAHPGMLLGKVQSGKTRTFISALALAFDNDFGVAVILTKNSKALLEQTKKRLEAEFLEFVSDGEIDIYDIMSAPDRFSKFELASKLIFLVKKETNNLSRLQKLVTDGCPALAQIRTLIIDDEADNASIGYSQKQGLIEANKIASQISQLRESIDDASFLQVTATPYSLYLQPDEVAVSNSATFSPTRPRFTKLVPVPADYVGGDTYFGDRAVADPPTVERLIHVPIDDNELTILKVPDRRRFKVEEALTSPAIKGLRKAIITFVAGGTIQRIRGIRAGKKPKKLRYSFLVHSEAARNAHAWQESIIDSLTESLTAEAAAGTPQFESLLREAYDDLSQSMTLAGWDVPSFDEVHDEARKALRDQHLTVSKVNSDEQIISMLDANGQLKLRSPLNVFVGGQVLDRGVTLDNLIGFYYGRRPNKFQQDTVLQHSRMYGYRRDDVPVTRFYTSNYIRSAMFEMERFDSALRNAIESGDGKGVQFIRKSSDGGVIPCSPNKILVATTHTLRPFRRVLPVGFQTKARTTIERTIAEIDKHVERTCGFGKDAPVLVPLSEALEILDLIAQTVEFRDEDDVKEFDWQTAKSILAHLTEQAADKSKRGQVLLWAAKDRNSARLASAGSHATFIETPDSEKTEGRIAKTHAIDYPILYLLRQEGEKSKGWRDANFYWPVIRAQGNIGTMVYTGEAIE